MITGNEPINFLTGANGTPYHRSDSMDIDCIENSRIYTGLTVRQYYAGLAMQGEISSDSNVTTKEVMEYLELPNDTYDYNVHWHLYLAKRSVAAADALIKELNK